MHLIELLDNKSEVLNYNVENMPIKLVEAYSKNILVRSMVNHWHNDFEFTYMLAGEMNYSVNGVPVKLAEGQMIFVNSGRMHYNYWDNGQNGDYTCTIFHPSMMDSKSSVKYLDRLICENSPPYIVLHPEIVREKKIIDLVLRLHEAGTRQPDGYELAIMSCIYEIVHALFIYIQNSGDSIRQNSKKLDAMHRMVGYVQHNYGEKISLADIAGAGFVSRTVCCEIFREFAGQTPVEYLTEYRVSKSAELLRDSDMSITEIASACGFGGSSYFTKTFRKIMGCTPTEFRQSI